MLLSESKSLSDASGRPSNPTTLKQLSDIFDIASALISAPFFSTAESSAAKVDLLQQIYLLRVCFVAHKEEKEEESGSGHSYAIALAAKKCWERVLSSAKEFLSKNSAAADQFLSTTCQQLVQRLLSSASQFSMDVFVETVRDLDEFAVAVKVRNKTGEKLDCD